MSAPHSDPHFFDCPSCKAFASLRLFGRRRHKQVPEYECSECHERYPENTLEQESAKRGVQE